MELILKKSPVQDEDFNIKLLVAENYGRLCEDAAGFIAGTVLKGLTDNGRFVLGMTAGRLTEGVIHALALTEAAAYIDWDNVFVFFINDTGDAPHRPGDVSAFDIWRSDGDGGRLLPPFEATNVRPWDAREVNAAGGIDLLLLAQGEDGRLERLDAAEPLPDCRKTVLISVGRNRAPALRQLIFGAPVPRIPVTMLKERADVTVFAGREAARLLYPKARTEPVTGRETPPER